MTKTFTLAAVCLGFSLASSTVLSDDPVNTRIPEADLNQAAIAGETGSLPHAFDAGWKGTKTCEVVFRDETVRIGRCVFPPGVGHEKHYHNPHFGYVLEGSTLLIRDANGEHERETLTGGTWSTTTRTVHEAVNVGESTTSYLIVESLRR